MNDALPGADLIEAGLVDLRAGHESVAALLVAIGSPLLRRLGLDVPEHHWRYPEHRLYHLLAEDDSDLRRLVSYERAAECEQGITLEMKLEEFLSRFDDAPEQEVIH